MRTLDVIDRIRTYVPEFASVSHALQPPMDFAYPAALVTPSRMMAPPATMIGGAFEQEVMQTFSVFVLLERRSDSELVSGIEEHDTLCAALRAALMGWQIDADHAPMMLAGGQLAEFQPGTVCWREDFSVETFVRIAP